MPAADFAKMVPGLDFLQGLLKNAGAGLPNMSQWIAPTLDPEELEKRIEQLRTVQFWLEQNARMLGTTIQALEVQRMTLSTLRTMNLPIDAIRDSMAMKPSSAGPGGAAGAAAAPEPAPAPAPAARASGGASRRKAAPAGGSAAAPAAPAVDPMQWWGALTKQFTDIAANALKDVPVDAARQMAEALPRKMAEAVQRPAATPAPSAPAAAPSARKTAGPRKTRASAPRRRGAA